MPCYLSYITNLFLGGYCIEYVQAQTQFKLKLRIAHLQWNVDVSRKICFLGLGKEM